MSNTKRYKVENFDGWSIEVAIDHDKMPDSLLHEINSFWSGANERLEEHDGNVTYAVLALLYATVWTVAVRGGYNLRGVVSEFASKDAFGKPQNGVEGWPALDGSEGLKLVWMDEVELDDSDLTIKEL